ncbi:conserved hypothetical protein [Neospora caninum Liverpool]|uniref:Uncharacterized protein n=1 Tax=Neospora caninum (strain Liverpool) TaxID=572307 RepID=F0VFP1_NEOCL|nr:conserved hypothetical protein [Neospora caninum Liverpool]CBZ52535.1 conserved hypothetical protein [Neospora caninum Liverpool]CEL66511.1 TPA: hypothetical protein BN1204_023230 [Neospora caninum Liverpool]|eukprot:XP_003882567.1 conserved hypothetical protein [Neospora caninum Liverpool]
MAQPAGSASPSQELPVSAPARYMTSAPVHWSYHYDAKPAARQRLPAAVSCPCPFEEPPQEDMNALLANALYDSIRASFPYILQTQYNYGVDTAGNVWGAYGYTPVRFAPERTRAAQLNQQAQQRIRTGK